MIKITDNIIHLKVEKAPLLLLIILYSLTFCVAMIAILILCFAIQHIMAFLSLFIFGYIAYTLLKISLWNTFGQEYIKISQTQVEYTADYKWFKSKTQLFEYKDINFDFNTVGYEDDKKAVLVLKLITKNN